MMSNGNNVKVRFEEEIFDILNFLVIFWETFSKPFMSTPWTPRIPKIYYK